MAEQKSARELIEKDRLHHLSRTLGLIIPPEIYWPEVQRICERYGDETKAFLDAVAGFVVYQTNGARSAADHG